MELDVLTSQGDFVGSVHCGAHLCGFVEKQCYRIIPPPGFGGMLLVDEIQLDTDSLGNWVWEPGFFAGEAYAELRGPDQKRLAEFYFDVSPNPNKLGRDLFNEMVEDLRATNPYLLFGTEPAVTDIGWQGPETTLEIQYQRLRRFGFSFVAALSEITGCPIRRLQKHRRLGGLNAIRQIDTQTIRSATDNPAALFALTRRDFQAGKVLFDLPVVRSTLDNGPNRTMRYFIDAVISRVGSVRKKLEAEAEAAQLSSTRTEAWRRWPERSRVLLALQSDLKRLTRKLPYSEVSRREMTPSGLTALRSHPAYARAHRLAWSILRAGIAGSGESTSMTTSWEVFERWCFLEVAKASSQVLRCAFRPESIDFEGSPLARYVVANGSESFDVRLQERFPSLSGSTVDSPVSISGERVPDITVRHSVNGKMRLWMALDAKYRTTRRNVLDAMSSAHVYHDALRIQRLPPRFSILLVPAAPETQWLCDTEFITTHGVGALVVSEAESLRELLKSASQVT